MGLTCSAARSGWGRRSKARDGGPHASDGGRGRTTAVLTGPRKPHAGPPRKIRRGSLNRPASAGTMRSAGRSLARRWPDAARPEVHMRRSFLATLAFAACTPQGFDALDLPIATRLVRRGHRRSGVARRPDVVQPPRRAVQRARDRCSDSSRRRTLRRERWLGKLETRRRPLHLMTLGIKRFNSFGQARDFRRGRRAPAKGKALGRIEGWAFVVMEGRLLYLGAE